MVCFSSAKIVHIFLQKLQLTWKRLNKRLNIICKKKFHQKWIKNRNCTTATNYEQVLLHECQWRQHDLDSPLSHITHISNFSSKENSRSGRCEGFFSLFCLSNSNSNYSEKSFRISIHPPPDLSNQSFHRFSKRMLEWKNEGEREGRAH